MKNTIDEEFSRHGEIKFRNVVETIDQPSVHDGEHQTIGFSAALYVDIGFGWIEHSRKDFETEAEAVEAQQNAAGNIEKMVGRE